MPFLYSIVTCSPFITQHNTQSRDDEEKKVCKKWTEPHVRYRLACHYWMFEIVGEKSENIIFFLTVDQPVDTVIIVAYEKLISISHFSHRKAKWSHFISDSRLPVPDDIFLLSTATFIVFEYFLHLIFILNINTESSRDSLRLIEWGGNSR
jgi:hypothetical protein